MINETKLRSMLAELDDETKVCIWDDWCNENRSEHDYIYDNNEEFFSMIYNNRIMDAVRAVCYGNYSYTARYVKLNVYGNLESGWSLKDFGYGDDDLVEFFTNFESYLVQYGLEECLESEDDNDDC